MSKPSTSFSAGSAAPDSPSRSGPESRSGRSLIGRLFRFCLRCSLALLVLLVIAAVALWFSRDWLMQKTETLVLGKLEEKQVYVSYESIDYRVLRGLRMSDVTLWEDPERSVPLIKLSDVAFRPSLTHLAKSRQVKGHLSIDEADLTLYDEGLPVCEFVGLKLSSGLDQDALHVNRLEASVFGMQFTADGFFHTGRNKNEDGTDDLDEDSGKKDRKKIDFGFFAAVAKWASFESKGVQPILDVNFHIDRNADDPLVIDGLLKGEQLQWRGLPLEQTEIEFALSGRDKTVEIPKLRLQHQGGTLEGEISYGLEARTLTVRELTSTLDPSAFLSDLPFDVSERLSMVEIESKHPEIKLNAVLQLKSFRDSTIVVDLPKPVSLTLLLNEQTQVALGGLHGKVAFDKGMIAASDLRATVYGLDVHSSGTVKLATKVPGTTTGDRAGDAAAAVGTEGSEQNSAADVAAKPKKDIRELLAKIFSSIEKWTSFSSDGANPKLEAKFSVDKTAADPVTVAGKLSGGAFRWQGASLDSADIDLAWSQSAKAVNIPRFELVYRGKSIHGGVNYAVASKQLRLAEVHCAADWVALALELPFGLEKTLAKFELPDPPELTMDGMVDIASVYDSAFTLNVPRSVPITVAAGERKISMDGFRGTVRMAERTVHSDDVELVLGGGQMKWNGAFTPSTKSYDGTLEMVSLPLSELLKLAEKGAMAGIINGTVTAVGDEQVLMRSGRGEISITETDALSIPIIGGLLEVLAKIAPVFGTTTEESVTVGFIAENGIMYTDDLTAKGAGFVVRADGFIDWNDKSTQFQATANFDGVMQLITVIASKALEIEGSGPLNDIQWRLKNLDPSKLTDSVRGLFGIGGEFLGAGTEGVRRVGEGVVRVGEGATDGVRKVGEGVVKIGEGATDGVRKVGEGVMKIGEGATDGVTGGVKKVREGIHSLIPGFGKKDKEKEAEEKQEEDAGTGEKTAPETQPQ